MDFDPEEYPERAPRFQMKEKSDKELLIEDCKYCTWTLYEWSPCILILTGIILIIVFTTST